MRLQIDKWNVTPHIKTFPLFKDELKHFLKHYKCLKVLIAHKQFSNRKLKPKGERICRFCNERNDPSLFKAISHLIPHMLGNHYIFSDFECDNCNKIFSKYESDLSYSLGIFRTMFSVKGKRGIPTFDSLSYAVRAKQQNLFGANAVILTLNDLERPKSCYIDKEAGQCRIRFKKQGYIPLNLYRILLKMALSVLPEKYAPHYTLAYEFILNKASCDWPDILCQILTYELPFEYQIELPVCYLFQKKDPRKMLPTHFFSLYFKHMIFEFPLYFYGLDIEKGLFEASEVNLPFCPPILYRTPIEKACFSKWMDLSSSSKLYEEQSLSFSFIPEMMTDLISVNPEYGEVKPVELFPDNITHLAFYDLNAKPGFLNLNSIDSIPITFTSIFE